MTETLRPPTGSTGRATPAPAPRADGVPVPGRVRVLMAGPDPAGRGGIETVMRLIMDRCSDGVDLTVVATHRHGSWLYRSVASVTGLTAALAQLAARRPDVVHLHVAKRGSLVRKGVLTWAASALRVPVVLHCHGGMFERDFRRMPPVLRKVVSGVFRRTAAVIVLSESWLSVYGDLVGVPAEKLTVAMNCVEVPAALPQRAAEPLGVAFLGRLGPQKGAWDLVRAVAALPAPLRARLRRPARRRRRRGRHPRAGRAARCRRRRRGAGLARRRGTRPGVGGQCGPRPAQPERGSADVAARSDGVGPRAGRVTGGRDPRGGHGRRQRPAGAAG